MKKELRIHRKENRRSLWQASRLEGKVKNTGIRAEKKPKQKQADRLKLDAPKKIQGLTDRERKDYQRKSKRRR
ncbi:hypothetical protein A3H16_04190 [Candidatus Kaiserbacteria bacterium RIFCSPLOWO2_12_FULL_53_8]|uniref:DUF2992 domain-containing protein n=2 Tax=Candidatus Kaiseribacteriota TaxID=1752734 RepID=A0A1F6CTU2_9BACT|nr:MAG: hypothetical protein A2851_00270 [Candidatus Kaiserbacteria bacterium RIFCSPHIGHO2_01_FULL_53_29]OGG92159.1 MAG: hypothetical protein A3H16_04190 [Candidatus Kaiserbacteria bacterium RIFCSPLOWO2_12_FULL_53_8]